MIKDMHTTMQPLGRLAIIGGTVVVALANVIFFRDVDALDERQKIELYASIYGYALIIPAVSVLGVLLAMAMSRYQTGVASASGFSMESEPDGPQRPEINWTILIGSLIFVIFSVGVGTLNVPFSQEIVFAGSVVIILYLMSRLVKSAGVQRMMIIGTAIIIFVFRAIPSPGPGLTWFEIDILLFNEQFFSVLSLLASILTVAGIIPRCPFMQTTQLREL